MSSSEIERKSNSINRSAIVRCICEMFLPSHICTICRCRKRNEKGRWFYRYPLLFGSLPHATSLLTDVSSSFSLTERNPKRILTFVKKREKHPAFVLRKAFTEAAGTLSGGSGILPREPCSASQHQDSGARNSVREHFCTLSWFCAFVSKMCARGSEKPESL